jgi:hypothetical protein
VEAPVESERGIASITLNNPELVLNAVSDVGFNPAFIFDLLSRYVVEVVLDQVSRRAVCDVRIVYERVREKLPELQFHQLTDLYTLMPIASALKELMGIVKAAAKRRALAAILTEGQSDAFRRDFCVTHFFNPVRYMPLLEIVGKPDLRSAEDARAYVAELRSILVAVGARTQFSYRLRLRKASLSSALPASLALSCSSLWCFCRWQPLST